jgi:hypothetical protein
VDAEAGGGIVEGGAEEGDVLEVVGECDAEEAFAWGELGAAGFEEAEADEICEWLGVADGIKIDVDDPTGVLGEGGSPLPRTGEGFGGGGGGNYNR